MQHSSVFFACASGMLGVPRHFLKHQHLILWEASCSQRVRSFWGHCMTRKFQCPWVIPFLVQRVVPGPKACLHLGGTSSLRLKTGRAGSYIGIPVLQWAHGGIASSCVGFPIACSNLNWRIKSEGAESDLFVCHCHLCVL